MSIKDNKEALFEWGRKEYQALVDGDAWGEIKIVIQAGKTVLVETRISKKPKIEKEG